MSTIRKTVRAGQALLRKGRLQEAQAKFDEALAIRPGHAAALHGRGQVALEAQAADEAVHWLERALAANPGAPDVLRSLTRARQLAQQAGARSAPVAAGGLVHKGRQLLASGRIEAAVAAYQRAVADAPGDAAGYCELGNAWLQDGRLEQAERAHRESLRLAATHPLTHLCLGEVLSAAGRRAEAEQAHREALRLKPNYGQAWLRVVQLRRYRAEDVDDLRALRRLVERSEWDAGDGEAAHFALGKIYDDLGQSDAAFEHLRLANELHKTGQPFEIQPLLTLMERIEAVCDERLLARFEGWGSTSEVPVFIVGLPRCGSTLVEQIIASHPHAYGVGELRRLARLTGDLPARLGSQLPFPDCLQQLTRKTARGLADDYLGRLTRDAGGQALRICDKMLSHLLLIGFIAVLFPKARVIHCQRHLMDMGLSIYAHSFSGAGVGYAYDLDDIGRYDQQCRRLMSHFARLAPMTIVDVHYETLVGHPEPEIRRLLAALGLDWDPRCLEFYKAKRQVRTVSEWQVREPIHTRSVERWRRYEKHLEPLRKYLE